MLLEALALHNRRLETLFPTIEQPRQTPELGPFIRWVRKQPPGRREKNKPRRDKL